MGNYRRHEWVRQGINGKVVENTMAIDLLSAFRRSNTKSMEMPIQILVVVVLPQWSSLSHLRSFN